MAVQRSSSLSGNHTTEDLEAFYKACLALTDQPELCASDRSALVRHAANLKSRLDHRVILDIRRQRGLLPALAALSRSSSAGLHLGRDNAGEIKILTGGGGPQPAVFTPPGKYPFAQNGHVSMSCGYTELAVTPRASTR